MVNEFDGRSFKGNEVEKLYKEFKVFIDGSKDNAKIGKFDINPLLFVDTWREKLLQYEPLIIVGEITTLCGENAGVKKLIEEESTVRNVDVRMQLQSLWFSKHLRGEINPESIKKLKNDAKKITEKELNSGVVILSKCKDEYEAAREALVNTKVQFAKQIEPKFNEAADSYRRARKDLLRFISPEGKMFDPGTDYVSDWKKECKLYTDNCRGVVPNGEFVREKRKERKLTQEQLAKELKLSIRTIGRMEQGDQMELDSIVRIAKFFKIDPKDLIKNDGGGDDSRFGHLSQQLRSFSL